jgi:hypothetical protein
MRADRIEFEIAGIQYSGRVNGDAIVGGESGAGPWSAVRTSAAKPR